MPKGRKRSSVCGNKWFLFSFDDQAVQLGGYYSFTNYLVSMSINLMYLTIFFPFESLFALREVKITFPSVNMRYCLIDK